SYAVPRHRSLPPALCYRRRHPVKQQSGCILISPGPSTVCCRRTSLQPLTSIPTNLHSSHAISPTNSLPNTTTRKAMRCVCRPDDGTISLDLSSPLSSLLPQTPSLNTTLDCIRCRRHSTTVTRSPVDSSVDTDPLHHPESGLSMNSTSSNARQPERRMPSFRRPYVQGYQDTPSKRVIASSALASQHCRFFCSRRFIPIVTKLSARSTDIDSDSYSWDKIELGNSCCAQPKWPSRQLRKGIADLASVRAILIKSGPPADVRLRHDPVALFHAYSRVWRTTNGRPAFGETAGHRALRWRIREAMLRQQVPFFPPRPFLVTHHQHRHCCQKTPSLSARSSPKVTRRHQVDKHTKNTECSLHNSPECYCLTREENWRCCHSPYSTGKLLYPCRLYLS
ncbi:unnamed protein product, partial [Protopolystoma xenopodis]